LVILSCGEEEPTGPGHRQVSPTAKPTSGDPSVSATDPTSAPQDTTLDVRVIGSNFDRGSRADLALDCEVDCTVSPKVQTNSTRFVSSGELVANITISADAAIEVYDVLVTTSKGKRGIGIELFAIKQRTARSPSKEYTATVIGLLPGSKSCRGLAVNPMDHVVGYCGSSSQRAFYWPGSGDMVDLGEGSAEDVSASGTNGTIVAGTRSSSSSPTALVWEPAVSSDPAFLPSFEFDGCPGSLANAVIRDGSVIVGSSCRLIDGVGLRVPVRWLRSGSSWSTPDPLPLLPGYTYGRAIDINENGMIVGVLLQPISGLQDGQWVVWPSAQENPVPLAVGSYDEGVDVNAIGPTGDVIGSGSGPYALLWRRNGTGWEPPVEILGGRAWGINAQLEIVGVGTWYPAWHWSSGIVTVLGWGYALDINDAGSVVGVDSRNRAVIWRPKP
jgi:hypothetical protein